METRRLISSLLLTAIFGSSKEDSSEEEEEEPVEKMPVEIPSNADLIEALKTLEDRKDLQEIFRKTSISRAREVTPEALTCSEEEEIEDNCMTRCLSLFCGCFFSRK